MGSYLTHGSKIYHHAHENPSAFSCISGPIFLESSIQCPSECNCLCHLRFITARDKQRLVSIYNTYVPSYCSIEISLDALGGLVHFDIQFLSTVHKSESTQAKGNMFLLKYQLVSGIPKDPKKLTYPSHKLQVTQVQALLKPDNKFTIFIYIHSPPQRGGKLARLLSPN